MAKATQKQINIRDDDIYERAHRIARRMKAPMKEAVRAALLSYERSVSADRAPDPDMQRRLAELDILTTRMAKRALKRTPAQDDAELYGPDGLPK